MVEHCLATSWEEKPARTPPLANRNGKRTATQKEPATRKGNRLQKPSCSGDTEKVSPGGTIAFSTPRYKLATKSTSECISLTIKLLVRLLHCLVLTFFLKKIHKNGDFIVLFHKHDPKPKVVRNTPS